MKTQSNYDHIIHNLKLFLKVNVYSTENTFILWNKEEFFLFYVLTGFVHDEKKKKRSK